MLIVNWDNPDINIAGFDIGGGEIYHYQGAPFTGILVTTYPNGNLNSEIQCINGYPEGFEREYFENGQIREESFIIKNRPYGLIRQWDKNGNLISEYDWGPEP